MSTASIVGYVVVATIGLGLAYCIVRAIVINAMACFTDFQKTFCCCFDLSGNASSPKPKRLQCEEPPTPDLVGLTQTDGRSDDVDTETLVEHTSDSGDTRYSERGVVK